MFKTKKAFTLIELLVVIAIIGLLATLSVIALSNARAKSRDSKRLADIKQMQTSLALYYDQADHYPTTDEFNSGSISATSSSNGKTTYMHIIPAAPVPNDGPCSASGNGYIYTPTDGGASYTLSFCIGGSSNNLAGGSKCATPGGILSTDCGGAGGGGGEEGGGFTCGDSVSYGGESYPTVSIGTQCWFAKNLNIGTMVAGTADQTNDSVLEKYCYNDNAANCTTYGAFYQWHEAMQLPASCSLPTPVDCVITPADPCCAFTTPHQGICPSGWHVSSDEEWTTLAGFVINDPDCDPDSGCTPAGTELKASSTSTPVAWDGTNSFGFSATPSGYREYEGWFGDLDLNADLWTSSIVDGSYSGGRYFGMGGSTIGRGADDRVYGYSVRCLKD